MVRIAFVPEPSDHQQADFLNWPQENDFCFEMWLRGAADAVVPGLLVGQSERQRDEGLDTQYSETGGFN
jgi:hypothetical protein